LWFSALLLASSFSFALADVEKRTLNDGNLILEDIPEIPREVFLDLYRFQNVRAAAFRAWTAGRVEYGDERDLDMRAHLEKISPLNNVDQISVPMFIVQGENDPRVPVTEAAQVVEALREQGHTVWYMNALNEGNGYRKRENRDIYQQATVLFFQKHRVDD